MDEFIGKKFGRLTVIEALPRERKENGKIKPMKVVCLCDCGHTTDVQLGHMTSGHTTSCGCFKTESNRKPRPRGDITGQRFGRLVVICLLPQEREDSGMLSRAKWLCLCDCGGTVEAERGNLNSGGTTSCGCYRQEVLTKHGMIDDELYDIWKGARGRITNPRNKNYSRYGGRGLQMDAEWVQEFPVFREYILQTIGPKPSALHSLDRIKNHLGYIKGNLRWATPSEQANNTRANIIITVHGVTATLAQHCERLGRVYYTVYSRLTDGWTIEQALETPTDGKKHYRTTPHIPLCTEEPL